MTEGRSSGALREACVTGLQHLAVLLYAAVEKEKEEEAPQQKANQHGSFLPSSSSSILESKDNICAGDTSPRMDTGSVRTTPPFYAPVEEEALLSSLPPWKKERQEKGRIQQGEEAIVHHVLQLLCETMIPQLTGGESRVNAPPRSFPTSTGARASSGAAPASLPFSFESSDGITDPTGRRSYLLGTAALLCAWLLEEDRVDLSVEEVAARLHARCCIEEADPSSWWWIPSSSTWGKRGGKDSPGSTKTMSRRRGEGAKKSTTSWSWLRLVLQAAVQPWWDAQQLQQLLQHTSATTSSAPATQMLPKSTGYAVSIHPPSVHPRSSRCGEDIGKEEEETAAFSIYTCHKWLWETLTEMKSTRAMGEGETPYQASMDAKGDPGSRTTMKTSLEEEEEDAMTTSSGLGEDVDLLHYYLEQVFQLSQFPSRVSSPSASSETTEKSTAQRPPLPPSPSPSEASLPCGTPETLCYYLFQRPVPVSTAALSRLVEIKGMLCYDAAVSLAISAVHSILHGECVASLLSSTPSSTGAAFTTSTNDTRERRCTLLRTVYARRCPEWFSLLVWSMDTFRIAASQWQSSVAEAHLQYRVRPALFGCVGRGLRPMMTTSRSSSSRGTTIEKRERSSREKSTHEGGEDDAEEEGTGECRTTKRALSTPPPPLLEVHPFVELSINPTRLVTSSFAPLFPPTCSKHSSSSSSSRFKDPKHLSTAPPVSRPSPFGAFSHSPSATRPPTTTTPLLDAERFGEDEAEVDEEEQQRIGIIAVRPIQEGEVLSREWPLVSWCRGDVELSFFHSRAAGPSPDARKDTVIGKTKSDVGTDVPAEDTITTPTRITSSSPQFPSPNAALADQLLEWMRTAETLLCQQLEEGTLYQMEEEEAVMEKSEKKMAPQQCANREAHGEVEKGDDIDAVEAGPHLFGNSYSSAGMECKNSASTTRVHGVAQYWRLLSCLSCATFACPLWAADPTLCRNGRTQVPSHMPTTKGNPVSTTTTHPMKSDAVSNKTDPHGPRGAVTSFTSSFPLLGETQLLQAGLHYFTHHPRLHHHPEYRSFTQDLYPPPTHSSIGISDVDTFKMGLSLYTPYPPSPSPPPSTSSSCSSSRKKEEVAEAVEVEDNYWSRVGLYEVGRAGYYFTRFYGHSCSPNVLLVFPEKIEEEKEGGDRGGASSTARAATFSSTRSTPPSAASIPSYTGEVIAIALRDIEPGEELCVSYLQSSPLSVQLSSRAVKATALSFWCRCSFCEQKAGQLEGTLCSECGQRIYSAPHGAETNPRRGATMPFFTRLTAAAVVYDHAEDCPRRTTPSRVIHIHGSRRGGFFSTAHHPPPPPPHTSAAERDGARLETALSKCYDALLFEDPLEADEKEEEGKTTDNQGGSSRPDDSSSPSPSSLSPSRHEQVHRSRYQFLQSLLQLDAACENVFPTDHYLRLRLRQELVATASRASALLSFSTLSAVLPIAVELLEDVLSFFPSPHPVATGVRMQYLHLRAAYIRVVERARQDGNRGGASFSQRKEANPAYNSAEEEMYAPSPYSLFTFGASQTTEGFRGEERGGGSGLGGGASGLSSPCSSPFMEKPFVKDPVLRNGIIQSFQEHYLQLVGWKVQPAWWQPSSLPWVAPASPSTSPTSVDPSLSQKERDAPPPGKEFEVEERREPHKVAGKDAEEPEILSSFLRRFPVELRAAGIDSPEGISMLSLMEDTEEKPSFSPQDMETTYESDEEVDEEEETGLSPPFVPTPTPAAPQAYPTVFNGGKGRHVGTTAIGVSEHTRVSKDPALICYEASTPAPLPGDFYPPQTSRCQRETSPSSRGSLSGSSPAMADDEKETLGELVEEGSETEIVDCP